MSEKDQRQFYLYLSKRSRIVLTPLVQKRIMDETGGRMLLSSELVRQYAISSSIDTALVSDEVIKKIELVWLEFQSLERDVIDKIIRGNFSFTEKEHEALDFLIATRVIQKTRGSFILTIRLLEKYLKSKKSNVSIEVDTSLHLLINHINMTSLFSKNERILLKSLLHSKENTVTRNTAAVLIWKTEEYTDWALDQFISRLRKKINSLHLGGVHIITLKKRGYQLRVK